MNFQNGLNRAARAGELTPGEWVVPPDPLPPPSRRPGPGAALCNFSRPGGASASLGARCPVAAVNYGVDNDGRRAGPLRGISRRPARKRTPGTWSKRIRNRRIGAAAREFVWHRFLRRFFSCGCGQQIGLVLRDGSDGRRADDVSPRPTTSAVAMVDTATFRGVNRFRRQTWVEVEPPMCLVVAVAFRDTPGLTAWEEPWEGGAGRNAQ